MGPNYGLAKGFAADTAIPKFRAVRQTDTEHCALANAAGQQILGVCQEEITANDATNGRIANIRMEGITRAIAGAAIAQGDAVSVAADGRVVPAPAPAAPAVGATTTVHHVGICMTAVTAAGDHIDLWLTPGAKAQRFG